MKIENKYRLSFTSNSLNIEESVRIAELYYQQQDWEQIKSKVLSENILQRKKESTIDRELREIKHRLSTLTENQLKLLVKSDIDTQKLLLLLAVAKTYQFIYDFIVEVIRNKYVLFDNLIYESDYEKFYHSKTVVHEKLNKLKDSTQVKIKRVLFTILAQAGIINNVKEKVIIQPILIPKFIKAVIDDDPQLLKLFLISDTDIKRYITQYG